MSEPERKLSDFTMNLAVHRDFHELAKQTPRMIFAGVCFVSRLQLGIEVRLLRYELHSGEPARPSVALTKCGGVFTGRFCHCDAAQATEESAVCAETTRLPQDEFS